MEAVTRFEGAVEAILNKLVESGYFKTRSEAIRAGILELGKEYSIMQTPEDLEAELVIRKVEKIDREIDAGKRRTHSLDSVLKQAGLKRK